MLPTFRPDSVAAAQKRAVTIKTREKKMKLKLVLALSLMLPMGAFADDHMPPTNIAAIYECNLRDGVTAVDVVAFGAGKFKNWAGKKY